MHGLLQREPVIELRIRVDPSLAMTRREHGYPVSIGSDASLAHSPIEPS